MGTYLVCPEIATVKATEAGGQGARWITERNEVEEAVGSSDLNICSAWEFDFHSKDLEFD